LLNADLTPVSLSKNISLVKLSDNANALDVGMDRDDADGDSKTKIEQMENCWISKIILSFHTME